MQQRHRVLPVALAGVRILDFLAAIRLPWTTAQGCFPAAGKVAEILRACRENSRAAYAGRAAWWEAEGCVAARDTTADIAVVGVVVGDMECIVVENPLQEEASDLMEEEEAGEGGHLLWAAEWEKPITEPARNSDWTR